MGMNATRRCGEEVRKRNGRLEIDIKYIRELKEKDSIYQSFASPAGDSIQLQMLPTLFRRMHEQKEL
jgi:hypothetical protein